jgi:hypothetical protein
LYPERSIRQPGLPCIQKAVSDSPVSLVSRKAYQTSTSLSTEDLSVNGSRRGDEVYVTGRAFLLAIVSTNNSEEAPGKHREQYFIRCRMLCLEPLKDLKNVASSTDKQID